MKRNIFNILAAATLAAGALALTACSEDDLDPRSVLDDNLSEGNIDPDGYCYAFDQWLEDNFNRPYNMEFIYRTEFKSTDQNYNLVPPTIEKAEELAVLTRYLWYDVYGKLQGEDFLRTYGPKIIHLIGSSGVNPANGTEILGLADGGLKVSLYKVNVLDYTQPDEMNALYFLTMHHEFTHILHQTKTYPKEFNLINSANYQPTNWQDRMASMCASMGFVSSYASGQSREDFAETCANYITFTPDGLDLILWMADRGWFKAPDGNNIANFSFPMKDQTFCYYYYASEKNRSLDRRTYCGQFYCPRDHCNYITDLCATLDADGQVQSQQSSGGKKIMNRVEDIEAFFQSLRDKGYELYPVEDTDNQDGKANILQKISIARDWYASAFGLNLDALREEVQYRQTHIDMVELMTPILGAQAAQAKYGPKE